MNLTRNQQSLHTKIIRHLRKWHRQLGIFTAIFLIFISISGIALNHTNALSLAHTSISQPWLLAHYGIKPPEVTRFYQHDFYHTDHYVWFNNELLVETDYPVIALTTYQKYLVVVTQRALFIFTEQGEMVDKLTASLGLPNNIRHIAKQGSHLVLQANDGYFQSSGELFDWQSVQFIISPEFVTPIDVENDVIKEAQTRYQAQFLSWERVILDAHSGRIFGDWGVLFMDLIAIMLILLSISGLYIWLRYQRKKR
ncbi:PepSY-associated TM helix domain-containing protein [Colwelliaceae bacterium 6441]